MTDLNKIVDDLSTLTVMQVAELTKLLENKWGVKAAPAAVTPNGCQGSGATLYLDTSAGEFAYNCSGYHYEVYGTQAYQPAGA